MCLPFSLLSLVISTMVGMTPYSNRSDRRVLWKAGLLPLLALAMPSHSTSLAKRGNLQVDANGQTFVWTIQDTYQGQTFFDRWDFFTGADPTHGNVNYTDRDTAIANNLVFVTSDNDVIMKGDNTTVLASGVSRNSVRISSKTLYNTGLFILDLNRAPWGCGVWPAWWTLGGNWPYNGEIDIIEGVHDNEHNQVTWHTGPNCTLTPSNFTGTIVQTNGQLNLDCDGTANGNAGCGVTEWSQASYGPTFDAQGGGVYAMKWDDTGIAVWSFYRAAVPKDVQSGQPDPSSWGPPVASLSPTGCDISKSFVNHSIVFDITFCGDWAGNSYATSGCPGTCSDRLMDPSNFVNASWSINSLQVFRKQDFSGRVSGAAVRSNEIGFGFIRWLPLVVIFVSSGVFCAV